jgi:hypothetical protein
VDRIGVDDEQPSSGSRIPLEPIGQAFHERRVEGVVEEQHDVARRKLGCARVRVQHLDRRAVGVA